MSRLNRSHPDKKDTFILDFVNEPGVIKEAFDRYYKTTILSGETDVNKLNDLIDTMESIQVYSDADVDTFVERYLADEPRDRLDPILDHCVEVYEGLIMNEKKNRNYTVKENGNIVVHNYCAAALPKITVTIHSGQTTYRFNGSYDGTRSLSGKLLDHMAKDN